MVLDTRQKSLYEYQGLQHPCNFGTEDPFCGGKGMVSEYTIGGDSPFFIL